MGTHTVACLEVSPRAFDEVAGRLAAAGYSQIMLESGCLDMSGIALSRAEPCASMGLREAETSLRALRRSMEHTECTTAGRIDGSAGCPLCRCKEALKAGEAALAEAQRNA